MNSRKLAQEWPFARHKEFEQNLRRASALWFQNKQLKTHQKMDYCLSQWSDWSDNLILDEVAGYLQKYRDNCVKQGNPFPLHKYAHHGLSSQTMAFNLIGPQITRNDYTSLIEVLRSKDIDIASQVASASFEYEDRKIFNEDVGQPTSIDIVLNDSTGNPIIFIESKLAEREFGGCSVFSGGDCDGRNPISDEKSCYLHFIGRRYWELMNKYGIAENLTNEKQCIFVAHYQFFREVLFSLEKGGIFVLLSDERSPVFHCKADGGNRGILPFLKEFIPDKYKHCIASISIQELVEQLKTNRKHEDWISEFELKYGMVKQAIDL